MSIEAVPAELRTTDRWDFSDLRALYVNCTLKRSPEPSHTQGLIDLSKAIMDACYGAAMELYAETSAKNANFKKLWDNLSAFQKDQILWFRVCENTYDNFMATAAQTATAAKK